MRPHSLRVKTMGHPLLSIIAVMLLTMFLMERVYAQDITFQSYQFSATKIYQGNSNVYVDLTIVNNNISTFVLHGAFVHFDWQAPDEFFKEGSQTAGEPFDLDKSLAPASSHTFRIKFSVPLNATIGGHTFYFMVFYDNGSEARWNPRAQDPFAELVVYSAYEPQYGALVSAAEQKVLQAWGAGFISPDARSLVQRAQGYLDDAYSYADAQSWQHAFSRLSSAMTLVDSAYSAEQAFRTYLIIGGIVAAAVIVIAAVFLRRRRKNASKAAQETKKP